MSNEKVSLPKAAIVELSIAKDSKTDLAKRAAAGGGLPSYTIEEVQRRFVSIKNALTLLGVKYEQYVRRLLTNSDIEGMKLKVGKTTRWLVSRESIEGRRARVREKVEGRNYILRFPTELEGKLREFLDTLDADWTLEFQYVPKDEPTDEGEPEWAKVIESI
jgi:hypothetical protein